MTSRAFLFLFSLLVFSLPAYAAPKYHFVIRDVDEAKGVASGIAAEAKNLLETELKRRPEVVMGIDPTGKTSYEVTLKIMNVGRALKDPAAGKQYRMLERSIALSLFGNTLPDHKLAIGGDGDAAIGAEIGKSDSPEKLEKQSKELLLDAAKIAVTQAVDMTLTKLKLAHAPVHTKKKAKP